MSVLVECFSVVVRRSDIERRYPASDEHLVRIGFMAQRDVSIFILRGLDHCRQH